MAVVQGRGGVGDGGGGDGSGGGKGGSGEGGDGDGEGGLGDGSVTAEAVDPRGASPEQLGRMGWTALRGSAIEFSKRSR